MVELVEDGDCRSLVTPTIRLVFRWVGDRWSHSLEVDRTGSRERVALAWSIEGDPLRDDPARVVSPAYQQLQFQESGSGRQGLLVGQSGAHHFSAVFTVEERPEGVRIEVDVADRCREKVEAMASTYRVEALSGDLIDADPCSVAWSIGPGQLTFAAIAPTHIQLSEAGRRATRVQAMAALPDGVHTRRCMYRWNWQPAGSRLSNR